MSLITITVDEYKRLKKLDKASPQHKRLGEIMSEGNNAVAQIGIAMNEFDLIDTHETRNVGASRLQGAADIFLWCAEQLKPIIKYNQPKIKEARTK